MKINKFEEEFIETISGTPQGSIISPTISNYVLNGLEEHVIKSIASITGSKTGRKNIYKNGVRTKLLTFHVKTVRYADDFIVMASSRRILELKIRPAIVKFLEERGVRLSQEKTQLFSLFSGKELNFLGYTFKYNKA
jgi:RNA-directed DNA polymerase